MMDGWADWRRRISDWKPYKGQIVCAELPEVRANRWSFRQLFYFNLAKRAINYPATSRSIANNSYAQHLVVSLLLFGPFVKGGHDILYRGFDTPEQLGNQTTIHILEIIAHIAHSSAHVVLFSER